MLAETRYENNQQHDYKKPQGEAMTDYNDKSKLSSESASNMRALESAIFNGHEQRLKALLTNLLFDELQKRYLVNLAKQSGYPEIVKLLKGAPATP